MLLNMHFTTAFKAANTQKCTVVVRGLGPAAPVPRTSTVLVYWGPKYIHCPSSPHFHRLGVLGSKIDSC